MSCLCQIVSRVLIEIKPPFYVCSRSSHLGANNPKLITLKAIFERFYKRSRQLCRTCMRKEEQTMHTCSEITRGINNLIFTANDVTLHFCVNGYFRRNKKMKGTDYTPKGKIQANPMASLSTKLYCTELSVVKNPSPVVVQEEIIRVKLFFDEHELVEVSVHFSELTGGYLQMWSVLHESQPSKWLVHCVECASIPCQ